MRWFFYGLGLLLASTLPAIPASQKVSPIEVKDCGPSQLMQKLAVTGLWTCASGVTFANPTATAGPTAVNGSATTAMRSDAAPAVQKGSASQFGIVEVDGTTITASGGVITATSGGGVTGFANPTATASDTAVNGSATTAMRSDAAPAIQKGSASQFGVVEVDGTSITASGGVISSVGGSFANPTATAGPTAVNGSATTAMRSDGAPAVQQGSASQKGIVQVDGTSITASSGVISATGTTFANPTATAGPTAVNGSATTAMRSDGAPAVQKASSSQFGIVEVDGSTITAAGGVISSAAVTTFANPTATASDTAVNGVATTAMRSDAAPAIQKATSGQFGVVEVDGSTITASGGVISAAGVSGANPTATAGPTAVNGSATTYLRSDGAPAVQQGSAAQKGIVQVDGTTITASSGVISATATAPGGSTGNIQYNNGSAFGGLSGTGLVLDQGSSAPILYTGTSCTNQFPRSLSASGAATCATVANADLANSSITLNAGSGVGITAPGAMSLGSTYTFGATSDTPRFAGLGLGGAATGANQLAIFGGTSGRLIFAVPAIAGTNTITFPAGTTDFSSTGGTSQFVKQASSGAALTVVRPVCADLSDAASGCSTATPTVKGVASIGWIATSNPDHAIVFTASTAMTITAITGTVDTAVGSTAAISIFKAASGTGCSGGTNLIATSGTFDANGTAVTNQSLALAGSGAPSMSSGNRVCLSTSNGTNFTSGAGIGGITVEYTIP